MYSTFVRTLLLVSGALMLLCGGEFVLEWVRVGLSPVALVGWGGVNNGKLVDILSPMARAYNNILAMLLATIGLAIPLTANMHTPKLIDMFLRDRLNRFVLIAMAMGAANVLWVATLIGPNFAPLGAYRVAVLGALAGWALLIPYFFYVVRFLDPSNILARLQGQVQCIVLDVAAGRLGSEIGRMRVHDRLEEIGTITLKSLDRADRGVALEGIWSLKRLIDFHGQHKAGMPTAWFDVSRKDFVGLSAEALELLREDRNWFEMKALNQAYLAYQQCFPKTSDVVSSISDAVRVVGVQAFERQDDRVLELCIRFFNSFLREAIKKRDIHSIYDVFYNYRLLARDLRERPDLLLAIGRYFRTYGALAEAAGLGFVPQLAAFDLGFIVRRAYEVTSPAASALLEEALALPHVAAGAYLPLVIKAKLVLGGFFGEHGLAAEAQIVAHNLQEVPHEELLRAEADLLAAERSFYEVTDRQVNFEYLAPERRAQVRRFVAALTSG